MFFLSQSRIRIFARRTWRGPPGWAHNPLQQTGTANPRPGNSLPPTNPRAPRRVSSNPWREENKRCIRQPITDEFCYGGPITHERGPITDELCCGGPIKDEVVSRTTTKATETKCAFRFSIPRNVFLIIKWMLLLGMLLHECLASNWSKIYICVLL